MTADRSRWIALYVLCMGMLMIVLDVTVVNVALPSIQDDLGFSTSSLAWVVNGYLISFGGLLLLAGRLGDLLGRRTIFLAGLALFTGASALCGLAQSEVWLVAARFVQGIGGAMTSAVILGMIVTIFPEPREQAKAIGVYAFVASAGGSVGLLAGGVLTQAIDWHWIFFINIPIGIATAIFGRRLLAADEGIGLSKGAVSITLLAAFVAREAKAATPLMPLRIFRSRNVTGANLIQVLTVAGMFGMFFLGSLYLQRVLGYDALQNGLAFLPVTIVMGTLSLRYSEKLIQRFGARTMQFPGLGLMVAGMVLFAQTPVDGSYVRDVLPALVLTGTGVGLCFPALMGLAMSGATSGDAGLASGLVNTAAQVGGALGLAVRATVSTSRSNHLAHAGTAHAQALTSGYHLAFLIAAGLVAAAIVVAAVVVQSEQRAAAATARAGELAYEGF